MKKLVLYFVSALLPVLFMGSTLTMVSLPSFEDNNLADRLKKEFNIGKGKKVEIELKTGGSIEVTGWDQDKVSVNSNVGENDTNPHLVFEQTSFGLLITTDNDYEDDHGVEVNLQIKVPYEFDVDLETMGGDVTLNNITGEFTGQTMGGDLELSSLKGEISLTTMGGDINLTNSDINGKVSTMGGRVYMENVKGGVKGTSMGGNVVLKNVTNKEGESTNDKVVVTSMGGDIDVEDASSGADVHTMGGDIKITSAKKHVKAKTMGGDIVIRSVDGGVSAVTMGGDVEVKVTGGNDGNKDIELKSMSGDIELYVPSDFSMDIDITLAYTDDYNQDSFSIKSDFDLKQETTSKWESKNNQSPRKYIYGTGKTGDGKHKIKIETINGNVILKRG